MHREGGIYRDRYQEKEKHRQRQRQRDRGINRDGCRNTERDTDNDTERKKKQRHMKRKIQTHTCASPLRAPLIAKLRRDREAVFFDDKDVRAARLPDETVLSAQGQGHQKKKCHFAWKRAFECPFAWKRAFKRPWREVRPRNHLDDKVDEGR
jgi:hypothetical protein